MAIPCWEKLCSRLWLVVVVLALLRSVLERTWTSAVGRTLLRVLEMTTLLVPTLVPCDERAEFSVLCKFGAERLPFDPPYRLVLRSFASPELPVLLPLPVFGFEHFKHLGIHEFRLINFLYSLRT